MQTYGKIKIIFQYGKHCKATRLSKLHALDRRSLCSIVHLFPKVLIHAEHLFSILNAVPFIRYETGFRI